MPDLVANLWQLRRRGLSYASDKHAGNVLLSDLSEGMAQAAARIEALEEVLDAVRSYYFLANPTGLTDAYVCDLVCDALSEHDGDDLFARIEKLKEALAPFSRVAGLVEPLAHDWDDERPAKDILPGIWPTWRDLKRARAALHPNNGGDE